MIHRIGDHHDEVPETHLTIVTGDPERDPVPIKRFAWEKYIRRSGLPAMTKLVALTMATYGHTDGNEIHPGDDNLAADTGLTKRSIITHRKVLEDLGFVVKKTDARRGRAAEYILTWPPNFNRLPGSRGPDGGPPLDL